MKLTSMFVALAISSQLSMTAVALQPPAKPGDPAPRASSTASSAATMARVSTGATIAAVRIDLRRFDPVDVIKQLEAAASRANPKASAAELADYKASLAPARAQSEQWRKAFLEAGGSEIVATVSLPAGQFAPPIVIAVPIGAGADTAKLTELCRALNGGPEGSQASKVTDDLLLIGPESTLESLPLAGAEREAEIRAAVSLVADAPIVAIAIPPQALVRAYAESGVLLPEAIGGGPLSIVSDGIRSGAVSVTASPDVVLKATFKSASPDAANTLHQWAKRMTDLAVKRASEGQRSISLAWLVPTVAADRVEITVDGDRARAAIDDVLGPMLAARAAARGMVIASQQRQIVMGCFIFAADHKDEWPQGLADVVKTGALDDGAIRHPTAGRSFVYIRPTADAIRNRPSTTIVLHESFDAWPQGGMWCAFADGHVELISEKSRFDAMLSAK